jgi:hypothetical protein
MDYLDKAFDELASLGVGRHVTWNQAREMLYDGRISQDAFDLYDDVWNTAATRFSVPEYQIVASRKRLEKRYA